MGQSKGTYAGLSEHGGKVRISFTFQGARRRETLDLEWTPRNMRAAARLREQILDEVARGVFDYSRHFPRSRWAALTGEPSLFGERAEAWLKGRGPELKAATRLKYRQVLDQFWLPAFSMYRLQDITLSSIRDRLAEFPWDDLSPKRWNDCLIPLRGVFNTALDDGLIDTNPTLRLRNKVPSPAPADPLDLEEIAAVIECLRQYYPESMLNWFEVAFWTGMRPGEQIALLWSDVDWGLRTLTVQRDRYLGITSTTKTGEKREHELSVLALAALKRQQAHTKLCPDGHVFHHPTLSQPFHETRAVSENWWAPVLKMAGVRPRVFYNTRHTYATQVIMKGANPYWVATQMGTSPRLVFETYGKWIKRAGGGGEADKLDSQLVPKVSQKT